MACSRYDEDTPATSPDGMEGGAATDSPTQPLPNTNDGSVACDADVQTSAEHCGRCNHSCLGGTCTAGRCAPITLAASQSAPPEDEMQILVRNDFVYWRAGPDSGRIFRVSTTKPEQPVLLATCATHRGLAIDDTNIFTQCSCDSQATAMDGGARKNGGTLCGHTDLAIDNDALYVSLRINVFREAPKNDLMDIAYPKLVPNAGYGSGAIHALAVHGGVVYHSYVDRPGSGVIGTVPVAGAATFTVFAPNEKEPRGLVADDVGVAWVDLGVASDAGTSLSDGAIRTQKLIAGTAATVAQGAFAAYAIAADADYVYFANSAGALLRAKRDGSSGSSAPEEIATEQTTIEGIAVDANAVYWVARGASNTGTVKKIAKP